jgi:ankyrin repeat protein
MAAETKSLEHRRFLPLDPRPFRVDDRRAGSGGTALHHATRAGFLRTITVLLEHGADPAAGDDEGATPADWLERATGSVDRQAVRALLGRGR